MYSWSQSHVFLSWSSTCWHAEHYCGMNTAWLGLLGPWGSQEATHMERKWRSSLSIKECWKTETRVAQKLLRELGQWQVWWPIKGNWNEAASALGDWCQRKQEALLPCNPTVEILALQGWSLQVIIKIVFAIYVQLQDIWRHFIPLEDEKELSWFSAIRYTQRSKVKTIKLFLKLILKTKAYLFQMYCLG